MPQSLILILAVLLSLPGCQEQKAKGPAAPTSATKNEAAIKATPKAALFTPGHTLAARLGPHRLTCKATTSSSVPGYPARKVVQEMAWTVDRDGNFHARKNTHEQYGQEVILAGGWLHSRLRHSKYVRRKPREREAARILDRMASYLPDYADLLARFLKLEQGGAGKLGSRAGTKIKLSLRDKPAPVGDEVPGPARRWRSSAEVTALSGEVLMDGETGVPLSVDLKARLTFQAPRPGKAAPANGIPAVLSDKLTGTMTLALSQRVDRLGEVGPIKAPPEEETVTDVRRRRLELERQILSGERPLPEAWRPEP